MPRFAYKSIDDKGVERFGVVEAESEGDALTEVGKLGLFVTDIHLAHMSDELRLKWQEQKDQKENQKAEEVEKEERRRKRERERQQRQRLVVRFVDGRTEYGVSYALNPRENSFQLDKVDVAGRTTGEAIQVRFADLKAVFFVKSFDGKFDKSSETAAQDRSGQELFIEFIDGEVLRGYVPRHYDPDEPRFFLVPHEIKTNNMGVLVERKAIAQVYTPEQYKEKRERERAERAKMAGPTGLTQEETTGDFYFETRNYAAALEQFEVAVKKNPHSGRLRKKILAAQYNVGIQFIKQRQYTRALQMMEAVLKTDPSNSHAKKKVLQLRKIVEKETKAGDRA